MSQFIKFYFTSSMLNMFRILIYPSSGACDFSIVSPHWLCVLVSMCVGVSVWLVGVVSVWQAAACSSVLLCGSLEVCCFYYPLQTMPTCNVTDFHRGLFRRIG